MIILGRLSFQLAKAIQPAAVEPGRRGTMKREKAYRGVFLAAGAYNILWGIYAVIDPQCSSG